MNKILIYKTKTGKYYIESDSTYKHTKTKTVLFELETDFPDVIKKTELKNEIKTMNDVQKVLEEIFGE